MKWERLDTLTLFEPCLLLQLHDKWADEEGHNPRSSAHPRVMFTMESYPPCRQHHKYSQVTAGYCQKKTKIPGKCRARWCSEADGEVNVEKELQAKSI